MRKIKYIFVNETLSPSPTSDALSSIVSDFRYSHIIDAAGLSRPELIKILELTRRHYPEAKILGLSEISGRGICPNYSMNQLRKKLSDLTPVVLSSTPQGHPITRQGGL